MFLKSLVNMSLYYSLYFSIFEIFNNSNNENDEGKFQFRMGVS